jgi:hypothetical protein
MSWPELRGAIETQISLFDAALRQWHDHQATLADARGQLHATLGSSNHPLARDGLQTANLAPSHASRATEHLAHAIQLCRDYLHAVDPDGANGSIRSLEPPQPQGVPHGGHGGPNVPPARQPITDPSRRRSHVYTEQGGPTGLADLRDRDDGIIAARADWLRRGGHAVDRHGGHVTDQQLQDRAWHNHDPLTGNTSDWEHVGEHHCGREATAFTSDAALMYAEMRVHDRPEVQARLREEEQAGGVEFKVAVPAASVLGSNFRDHLRGYSRVGSVKHPTGATATHFPHNTQIAVMYRRAPAGDWVAYTCYPQIPKD